MLELTFISPAEILPPESTHENAILWRAEAKPLPTATPSDDNAQEIVILPGSEEELRLLFDAYESELTERVTGVCNTLYVTSGVTSVRSLLNAIVERGLGAPPGRIQIALPYVPTVRGERVYVNAAATPKRHALKTEVESWLKRFASYSKESNKRVEVASLKFAHAKLNRSLQQTLHQAGRYFKLDTPQAFVGPPSLVREDASLTGPDASNLVDAITQIAAMRRQLGYFRQLSDEAKAAVRKIGLVDSRTGVLGPALLRAAVKQDLRGMLDVPSATSALARATQGFDATTRVLAQECAEQCRTHPVLFRLWDQPIVFDVADLLNNTPATQKLAKLNADGRLRASLASILNETTSAADSFIADLRTNPEEIWRYERAILGGLSALHLNQGDIAWRAAEEHLERQRGALSPLSQLNLGLGIVEMIAATSAVAPPVAVVIALLSAGAGIAELLESAVNEARKDRAFQACLDPVESLALEGSSYASIVIGALFIVLQLRGVQPTALKATRVP